MSVSINSLTIDGDYIEIFEGYLGGGLILTGKALKDEGKKICAGLNTHKKGDIVQIRDDYKFKWSGVYEIEQVGCSVDTTKTPIYSFKIHFKKK